MQFEHPTPGKTITVSTRFRSIFFKSETGWDEHTYTGVVAKPDPRTPQGSFVLLSDDEWMPRRTIALRNVQKLEYADGTNVTEAKLSSMKTWEVKGSKGNVYTITEIDGVRTCDCAGFTYRKDCKHVKS